MKIKIIPYVVFAIGCLLSLFSCHSRPKAVQEEKTANTFANPLLKVGAEPYATYHNGKYYYMHGTESNLTLWATSDLTDLRNAPSKVVWKPTDHNNAFHLWGPEIHFIENKWYIYYAADDGNMDNHQIYVLENDSLNPFDGKFVMKGRIGTDKNNNWAIHPNVFSVKGNLYMTWSGWESRRVDTETQCIYIAEMKNPWTLASERVMISKPDHEWERQWINPDASKTSHAIYVNEAPQSFFSKNKDKVLIYYCGSGNWTPYYAVGLLSADVNSNLLDKSSWTKSEKPVFHSSPADSVFGPGNISFVPSPDQKEWYVVYHARKIPNEPAGGIDSRSPRMQKIDWDTKGFPILGNPISEKKRLPKPSVSGQMSH